MSGSPPPQGAQSADPSMEDILASIRRILSEEDSVATTPAPVPPAEVLELDESMIVHETVATAPQNLPAEHPEKPAREPAPDPVVAPAPPIQAAEPPVAPLVAPLATPLVAPLASSATLMAPEAAEAAASAVGHLVRTLAVERSMQVRSTGPTIEDIVREEIRPLLKTWLDENLPAIVERLVRAEIERVVGRGVP